MLHQWKLLLKVLSQVSHCILMKEWQFLDFSLCKHSAQLSRRNSTTLWCNEHLSKQWITKRRKITHHKHNWTVYHLLPALHFRWYKETVMYFRCSWVLFGVSEHSAPAGKSSDCTGKKVWTIPAPRHHPLPAQESLQCASHFSSQQLNNSTSTSQHLPLEWSGATPEQTSGSCFPDQSLGLHLFEVISQL